MSSNTVPNPFLTVVIGSTLPALAKCRIAKGSRKEVLFDYTCTPENYLPFMIHMHSLQVRWSADIRYYADIFRSVGCHADIRLIWSSCFLCSDMQYLLCSNLKSFHIADVTYQFVYWISLWFTHNCWWFFEINRQFGDIPWSVWIDVDQPTLFHWTYSRCYYFVEWNVKLICTLDFMSKLCFNSYTNQVLLPYTKLRERKIYTNFDFKNAQLKLNSKNDV